jgi:hypothetical protein
MKQKCDKNNTPSLVDKAHDGLVLAPGEQILFEGMMHVQINGKSYTTDGKCLRLEAKDNYAPPL